jgi:hypothetical protein
MRIARNANGSLVGEATCSVPDFPTGVQLALEMSRAYNDAAALDTAWME